MSVSTFSWRSRRLQSRETQPGSRADLREKPRRPLTSTLKVMSVIRAIAFFWGLAACIVIAYFGAQWWSSAPSDPLRAELLVGSSMGLVYGSPAWVSLPLLAWLGRKELSVRIQRVLLLPPGVAVLFTAMLAVKGGA